MWVTFTMETDTVILDANSVVKLMYAAVFLKVIVDDVDGYSFDHAFIPKVVYTSFITRVCIELLFGCF